MFPPPDPSPDFLALQQALAGRYSLERELGRGGMGVVYLAQDVGLDRPVALKLLPAAYAAQPVLRERFIREARTAARLSHPNIVPIHLVDVVDDFVFFVMSFVEGETLGRRVRERGPVPPREAARILREVAWAVAYAHAQGVVHRDVKPDNILLETGSGRAMVTDFGIAHVGEAAGLTSVGEVLGTPEFMSPEQASGKAVDARSDLYSLGVVGHYMLSGTLPFQGKNAQATLAKQLTQPAPLLAAVAPEVPGPLAEAVDRCLAKDPAVRIQGGEALADALGRVLQDRKDVPVAIRAFQEQNREATLPTVLLTGMLLAVVAGMAYAILEGISVRDAIPGLIASSMFALIPPAMLAVMSRRLLKAGYGHDELVRALRSDVEDRHRAVASQAGGETALDVWAPRVGGLGVLLFVVGMVAIPFPAMPIPLIENLLFGGMALSVVGGGTAAIRHNLRKAVPGQRWLQFWDSPVGKGIFAAAGLGLDRGSAVGGSYRPTELAIGMAADRLFEDLPKDVRKSLGDLPGVVKMLERHAEVMRARTKELDRMLVDVGEAEVGKRGGKGDGGGAPARAPDAGQKRDAVADELRRTREAAEERLRAAVTALEGIRLELLRLHAGSGTVESMTADLAAARELSEDMERLTEGRREVERVLAPGREPDTPVPT